MSEVYRKNGSVAYGEKTAGEEWRSEERLRSIPLISKERQTFCAESIRTNASKQDDKKARASTFGSFLLSAKRERRLAQKSSTALSAAAGPGSHHSTSPTLLSISRLSETEAQSVFCAHSLRSDSHGCTSSTGPAARAGGGGGGVPFGGGFTAAFHCSTRSRARELSGHLALARSLRARPAPGGGGVEGG